MAVLLYSLRAVPEDEAEELRALLASEGIVFHETTGGLLGLGTPGIWLTDARDLQRARALIAAYQRERRDTRRAEYERLREQGRERRLVHILREDPLRFLLYLAVVLAVLYLSVIPFWKLIR
ncbi:MAG: DUF6164 family protein [Chromatiales bacterium]|jgi:hypothetical protein